MILTATINEVKRRILFDNPQAVVAVKGDYEVNGIAFAFPAIYEDDFDLSTAVKTVYYKATDGIIYNHVVTATDTDTGYPLWVFKDEINKGAYGDVEFALVCDKVEGGNIVKRWVSMITAFRVQRSIEIDESEQEENEQTYSERLAYLMTQMANMQATVSGLASGAPTAVSLASGMTDTNKLYVYTGSESGYTEGHWYYYNGSAWADGGQYGGTSVDATLTVSGAAADAKVVGDEIATVKEDLNAKQDALTFDTIPTLGSINPVTSGGVATALTNITVPVDATLTKSGAAADAKVVGDEIATVKEDLGDLSNLETLDKTNIVSAINSLTGIVRIIANRNTSWAGIRENVKSGYGEILYPVGTDFSVSCPSGAPYNNIVFTVVNHRVENNEPIMALLMKRCIYDIQFDAPQAAFVASEAMAAGTYHFKLLDGYDTGHDGGKYVQFTIVNPLVAGDQIVITWGYNQSWIGKNAYVYHAFDTTPVETCAMSEGQDGTYLGVADGSSANLNHAHRLRIGSNNWKESAVREWLNSDAQAGAWQTQQTKFQRPCSYASSKAGFMSYLDPSFVATVRTGTHLNRTNQIFDLLGTNVAYSTDERFFLLSNEEIGFPSESGIVCGSLFSFYDGANNGDTIKYDIANENTARYWWLRTPDPSGAGHERGVHSSGALSGYTASYSYGAAAACEI